MQYRPLGRSGMRVSSFGFGAMMLGSWGNPDPDDCARMVHSALDAGINFIDTADIYGEGDSEQLLGDILAGGPRDEIVLATKFSRPMGAGPNRSGASRRWIMRAVDESLTRLRTDWIDLYQIHRPDPETALEETLSALTDLQRSGKIRAFGTSTFPAHLIVEAQWVSRTCGCERFVSDQPPYSLLVRGIERAVLPVCSQYRLGVVTWAPLAAGWLSGNYRLGQPVEISERTRRMPERYGYATLNDPRRPENEAKLKAADALASLAGQAGLTLVQMALAFARTHPAVTSVLVGGRTPKQLAGQLAAADVVLTEDVLDAIDAIVAPGETLERADDGYAPPELAAAWRRPR